ncbi:uclacyanin 1-like [Medicago truncatula]|uniref:uclacyanin 1-like n=1 Tax=Medicago truncatula TaxID=3880 RepID=UPI001968434A|nr:uclacyanin 1-like [Medicago truncatula]
MIEVPRKGPFKKGSYILVKYFIFLLSLDNLIRFSNTSTRINFLYFFGVLFIFVFDSFLKLHNSGEQIDSSHTGEWSGITSIHFPLLESFNVGDNFVFTYTPLYDVIEVNQQGYNTCTIANAISTYNSGETVIHVIESGKRYFVCGRMGHCQQGLKLKVKVQAQSNNTSTYFSTMPSFSS